MEFLKIGKSPIHGKGIFTSRSIKEGECFYKIPLDNILHEARPRCAFIGKNRWVSDEKVLNWINHSCDPNTKFDIGNEPRLIALKEIRKGQEITCDYNETEKGGERVACNCKKEKCKGYFLRIE